MKLPDMVWVDVETTGLSTEGKLLEVGFVTTDSNLKVLSKSNWLFSIDRADLSTFENEALKMHSASGLLFDCLGAPKTGLSPHLRSGEGVVSGMERWLKYQINWVEGAQGFPMAGSSVHFDRAWLKARAPLIEKLFHYRNIDVSTLKNLARLWYPDLPAWGGDRKTHRAIADIEDSIAELAYYRECIFSLGSGLEVAQGIMDGS